MYSPPVWDICPFYLAINSFTFSRLYHLTILYFYYITKLKSTALDLCIIKTVQLEYNYYCNNHYLWQVNKEIKEKTYISMIISEITEHTKYCRYCTIVCRYIHSLVLSWPFFVGMSVNSLPISFSQKQGFERIKIERTSSVNSN